MHWQINRQIVKLLVVALRYLPAARQHIPFALKIFFLSLGFVGSAHATTTYVFTSDNYLMIATSPYNSSMHATMTFQVDSPLTASTIGIDANTLPGFSASWNDGLKDFAPGNSTNGGSGIVIFSISTNAAGLPFAGDIEMFDTTSTSSHEFFTSAGTFLADGKVVYAQTRNAPAGKQPGSWSIATVPTVPEPADVFLVAGGLALVLVVTRRRRPFRRT